MFAQGVLVEGLQQLSARQETSTLNLSGLQGVLGLDQVS